MWGHPLVTTNYVALTPSMPVALGKAMEAVMYHKKCLVFEAIPRAGKSTTCRFVVSALTSSAALGDRFMTCISADTNDEPKYRESIIKILAKSLEILAFGTKPYKVVRSDVINSIESRVRNKNGRHWILFLDEMQALSKEDFRNLQVIQNELALHNIDTTVIGFSQSQMLWRISDLKAENCKELVARFASDICNLPCCSDSKWMIETLKRYDDEYTYPEQSGCTFTQFFLPRAYAAGFRYASTAPDIYQVMSQCAKNANLNVLPTALIFDVFRFILIRSMGHDAPGFTVTQEMIDSAIAESRLRSYADLFQKEITP
ncbi:hypothetical protein CRM86_20580 [Pseudomonas putida]|nr:hypothetical protein CRM86_20580 [Pseudomonas putida]